MTDADVTGSASSAPRPHTDATESILTADDLKGRVVFFGQMIVQMFVDFLLLCFSLSVLVGGSWTFDRIAQWFPKEVSFIKGAEKVFLIATSIVVVFYLALDVLKTLRRTWEVLMRGDNK